jgi:hypothetical protein
MKTSFWFGVKSLFSSVDGRYKLISVIADSGGAKPTGVRYKSFLNEIQGLH